MSGIDKVTTGDVIERLYKVILSRKGMDPSTSYTASLFDKGLSEITRKVGEESIETMVAALTEDKQALINESADVFYHLLVLWAAKDVTPGDVFGALADREGVSGIDEKASRT